MPNILIIDDDDAIRRCFSAVLEPLGTVESLSSADQAVSLLAVKRYDAIVLDLHMTPLDGFGLLDHIRAMGGPNVETPVLLCSADFTLRTRARAIEYASLFVLKPVRLSVLYELVAHAIGGLSGSARRTSSPVESHFSL